MPSSVDIPKDAILARVRAAAMRGIVRGTEAVRTEEIRRILNPPKTGRVYRRRGVEHQASAPGEAPASDTGRLANSITTDYNETDLVGTVTARTEYAAYLEYGTQKMEPRPFARPSLAALNPDIQKDIADEVQKAMK